MQGDAHGGAGNRLSDSDGDEGRCADGSRGKQRGKVEGQAGLKDLDPFVSREVPVGRLNSHGKLGECHG